MKAGALAKLADAQAQLEAVEAEVQPTLDAVAQLGRRSWPPSGSALPPRRKPRRPSANWRRFRFSSVARRSASMSGRRGSRCSIARSRSPIPTNNWEPTSSRPSPIRMGRPTCAGTRFPCMAACTASQPKHAGGHRHQSSAASAEAGKSDVRDAKTALDRISIPKEVTDRISQMVSPGSALIVSDEPLSRETGQATEFVVIMSGEPQGGIKIRRASRRSATATNGSCRRSPYGWGPSPFW